MSVFDDVIANLEMRLRVCVVGDEIDGVSLFFFLVREVRCDSRVISLFLDMLRRL